MWQEVRRLLEDPDRVAEEYERRLREGAARGHGDLAGLDTQLRELRQGKERLIDSYADGLINQTDFTPRMTRLKERIAVLEHDVAEATAVAEQQQELRLAIGRLENFAVTVRANLEQVAWDTRRTLIRTLVKRVEVDLDEIRVIFRIGPDSSGPTDSDAVLPDHGRRLDARL